jgi:hypothetical protein
MGLPGLRLGGEEMGRIRLSLGHRQVNVSKYCIFINFVAYSNT